jgi:serine/threonine protein kinase
MERGSLGDIIQHPQYAKQLDGPLVLRIATDITNGMAFLHSKRIIHRDLKSTNILLDLNWRAKVADFGASRMLSDSTLTTLPGTARYSAPEVFRRQHYTEKADVYSFGMVLWEMASLRVDPFPECRWAADIGELVVEGRRPEIPANCPPLFKVLIPKCWAQNAEERPTFADILERYFHATQETTSLPTYAPQISPEM